MINPQHLIVFASHNVATPSAVSPEASYRRAMSACYYALFHCLARSSAAAYVEAGPDFQHQAIRSLRHTDMRKVCERYMTARANPPGPDKTQTALLIIARLFIRLQEARETADYDLFGSVSREDALECLDWATQAVEQLAVVEHHPATTIFVASMLLGDRLVRRG